MQGWRRHWQDGNKVKAAKAIWNSESLTSQTEKVHNKRTAEVSNFLTLTKAPRKSSSKVVFSSQKHWFDVQEMLRRGAVEVSALKRTFHILSGFGDVCWPLWYVRWSCEVFCLLFERARFLDTSPLLARAYLHCFWRTRFYRRSPWKRGYFLIFQIPASPVPLHSSVASWQVFGRDHFPVKRRV